MPPGDFRFARRGCSAPLCPTAPANRERPQRGTRCLPLVPPCIGIYDSLWQAAVEWSRNTRAFSSSSVIGVSRIPIKNDTVLFGDIDDRLNLSVGLDSLGHPANNKILSIEPKRFVVKTRSKRVH